MSVYIDQVKVEISNNRHICSSSGERHPFLGSNEVHTHSQVRSLLGQFLFPTAKSPESSWACPGAKSWVGPWFDLVQVTTMCSFSRGTNSFGRWVNNSESRLIHRCKTVWMTFDLIAHHIDRFFDTGKAYQIAGKDPTSFACTASRYVFVHTLTLERLVTIMRKVELSMHCDGRLRSLRSHFVPPRSTIPSSSTVVSRARIPARKRLKWKLCGAKLKRLVWADESAPGLSLLKRAHPQRSYVKGLPKMMDLSYGFPSKNDVWMKGISILGTTKSIGFPCWSFFDSAAWSFGLAPWLVGSLAACIEGQKHLDDLGSSAPSYTKG